MNTPPEMTSSPTTPTSSPPSPSNERGPSVSPSTEHGPSGPSNPAQPLVPTLEDWKNTWRVPQHLRAEFTFAELISGLNVIYDAASHRSLKDDLMAHLIATKASRMAALAAAKVRKEVEISLRS